MLVSIALWAAWYWRHTHPVDDQPTTLTRRPPRERSTLPYSQKPPKNGTFLTKTPKYDPPGGAGNSLSPLLRHKKPKKAKKRAGESRGGSGKGYFS